ncbi:MAG: Fe-S-containing hydro-lyase [Clostridiales bacterium]|jgi:fumarate hydratase subunit beta|nr:Fe-S-containing hydro-lyase [Clostridiales bacterium]
MKEFCEVVTPFTEEQARSLKAGDRVLITGELYTGRDAAHKRLIELVNAGGEIPFDIKDSIIYYVGPTPAKPGAICGSAGPTSSYRMDKYAPTLMELGLRGMIGKGIRNHDVIETMKRVGAVYFAATGGAGALLSQCVNSSRVIAYEDLGPEAVRLISVTDFPAIVAIDSYGANLYDR